jgi:hypothetical protein
MPVPDDPEVRFALAISRLLKSFNLIDTNVGLCLSYLKCPSNPKAAYKVLANQTSQQRFDELEDHLFEGVGFPANVDLGDFRAWFADAARARSIRNRYIHGLWEYLPLRVDGPVEVSAPPWMKEKLGELAKETMTLAELEAVADNLAEVFDRFRQLRNRYKI